MATDKINTASIYSIKRGFEIADKPVSDDGCINLNLMDREDAIKIRDAKSGRLFTKKTNLKRPRWAQFFEDTVPPDYFGIGGVPSAVLIVEVGGREYALTFGQGRYLINPDAIEEQFGLRVALNILDVKALRSLDKRSFDTISKQSREQASR